MAASCLCCVLTTGAHSTLMTHCIEFQPPNTGPLGVLCHGPHIHEEWWVGPASGQAEETAGWRRSLREFSATPHDAFLMAQPATLNGKHVFVGSNEQVLSVPQYRISGLYSYSNAELVTPAFAVPAGAAAPPIALNANATWSGRLVTGGCDEGCAAYIYVEVLDAASNITIEGAEANSDWTRGH